MSTGSHIRAIGPEGTRGDTSEVMELAESDALPQEREAPAEEWEEVDEPAASIRAGWLAPTLALVVIAAWTAFFGWSHLAAILGGASPQEWSALIVDWAVPVLLVLALWLLAMRTSRREATRFTDAAHALSLESAQLEQRLSTVNRELSLAREFIGAQSRELESLGRVAADRLSVHADRLQELIRDNGAQVDAIAHVSTSALDNMERLRSDLPVIANSARDVSNQIGHAGGTANDQLGNLVAGFERLNEFGAASERQVATLRKKVDGALAAFQAQADQLDEIASVRFAALAERGEEFRAELDGREVEALAAMRRRADQLREEVDDAREALDALETESLNSLQARIGAVREGVSAIGLSLIETEDNASVGWRNRIAGLRSDLREVTEEIEALHTSGRDRASERLTALREQAGQLDDQLAGTHRRFLDDLAQRREAADAFEAEAVEALDSRMAAFDANLAERRDEQIAQTHMLTEHGEAIAVRLQELGSVMEQIACHGRDTGEALGGDIEALTSKLAESREALSGTGRTVSSLTEASVRLLELIQAAAQHSGADLSDAIGMAETRLTKVGERADTLRLTLQDAGSESEKLSEHLRVARENGQNAIADLDAFGVRFSAADDDHRARINELRTLLGQLGEESDTVSLRAQGELRQAIATLEDGARKAVAAIDSGSADSVRDLASRIGDEASQALERALRIRTEEAIGELEEAATRASGAGREATIQLRDQLVRVNELAGNLEARVARARELAEEQVGNDFSRRVALITESLNSNSIDIAKALSTDVTDTAWASYLRGDRGIFTRRAVRLLDKVEAREIAETYNRNDEFREHVSRYIHDFEAMLRSMLSTRDGNALAVTLLSSDMGKLYVALAQAIERLRN